MIDRQEVITDGDTYYLEGNIGQGQECEYVSTNNHSELEVYGESQPGDNGVFVAKLKSGTENMWAFQDESSTKYLTKGEESDNAESTSEDPVYFQLTGDDVNEIIYETPTGDHLYLSMFDTEEGSHVTFAAKSTAQTSKQKWKFVKTGDSNDLPGEYGV
tara:strand:+ start:535 stop:1011 length:477 start_codon:yes stop_codon:yes gene_type:complete